MKPHRAYDKVDVYRNTLTYTFNGRSKPLRFNFHPPRTIGKANGRSVIVLSKKSDYILRGTVKVFSIGVIIYDHEDGTKTPTVLSHDDVVGWIFDNCEFLLEYERQGFPDKLRLVVVGYPE